MNRVVNGAQTLSKARDRFPGAYPRSLVRGRGAQVADDRGQWYTDWICALGAISLGYHDAEVERAVHRQASDGPIFSLPNVGLEEAVAEQLCSLVPCAEAVRFVKTGSEATEAAIRVARAATGRDVVLVCGYHGWYSWYAATRIEHPGVPEAMTRLVRTFVYNATMRDPMGYGNVLDDAGARNVAAIILEPTLIETPRSGFLESLRDTATAIGAFLIFDEMVTGFRWHAGGYQALCGVTPDLATFGKGMANGYPVAALVGRAEPMRWARLVSGTFGGDCVGLAAARATIARYQRGGVCEHMRELGSRLIEGYNLHAVQIGAPTRMEGQPPHPRIVWDEILGPDPAHPGVPHSVVNRHRASLFFQECVRRGVLFHPDGINISLAHTHQDVERTLGTCVYAMEYVAAAIAEGRVYGGIIGNPISPEPPWRITA